MDGNAGFDRPFQKPGMELGRMQAGKIRAQHAAVIKVATDFPVLFRLRNHLRLDVQMLVEEVRLATLGFVVRRAHGADEAADPLVIAVDVFGVDERRQALAGDLALAINAKRRLQALGLDHLAEAYADVAAGQAAVAGRGARARVLLVENLYRASGSR